MITFPLQQGDVAAFSDFLLHSPISRFPLLLRVPLSGWTKSPAEGGGEEVRFLHGWTHTSHDPTQYYTHTLVIILKALYHNCPKYYFHNHSQ